MINIAIDGPSGAGKSTISRRLASEFGYVYIDTGALYRAVGLYAFRNGIDSKNAEAVAGTLDKIEISFTHDENGVQRVYLNGEDVSADIRQHEISMYASNVSAIPSVRAFLLELQRSIAEKQNVVMDGRDIGTVILPNAQVKLFLTATCEDRARRRYEELVSRGQEVDYEKVLADMRERDENDSKRAAAPLKQADDAVLVDTTGCTLEEGYLCVKAAVDQRMKEKAL